ncbi:GGDEF domain-containing protein [Boseaceae bacterium BT-24-1]|nr:GGDEF domain-containing protein [Boseaceae bacterium BT-24-1]
MSKHRSLSYQFWAATALILSCSVVLSAILISTYYRELQATRLNEKRLERFQLVMRAVNRLSAERGPVNSVLGEEHSTDSPSRKRLITFQANTDAALDQLAPIAGFSRQLAETRRSLAEARQLIDALDRQPLRARRPQDFHKVVLAMFGVVDTAQTLVDAAISDFDPAGSDHMIGTALVARMLSDIREQVGRMGSNFVASIAARTPIGPEHRSAHDIAYGRVLGFWQLVEQQTGTNIDPQIAAMRRAVVEDFFGKGMAIYRELLATGQDGNYAFDTITFTNQIVPTFASLERLRDMYLDSAMTQVKANGEHARRLLIIISAITLIALLLELVLVIASQTLLFRPLLSARDAVMALAAGKTGGSFATGGTRGEIGSLFKALDRLRGKLIERDALDREKLKLTARLRQLAETDGLTGILNRGALEQRARSMLAARAEQQPLPLILLDIDHFKRINDNYGHIAGDEVLKETARRLQAALRPADVIARFGGEEFAILLSDPTARPDQIAERLRAFLAAPFTLDTGATLNVTASFGVAALAPAGGSWPDLVEAADQALYEAKAAGRNRVVARTAA